MFKNNQRKAQSIVEFTIMIMLVLAVFLTMNGYVKRGFQGRWKTAIDDFGDQYDPQQTNANLTYTMNTDSISNIYVDKGKTYRRDTSNSVETRFINTQVGQNDIMTIPE